MFENSNKLTFEQVGRPKCSKKYISVPLFDGSDVRIFEFSTKWTFELLSRLPVRKFTCSNICIRFRFSKNLFCEFGFGRCLNAQFFHFHSFFKYLNQKNWYHKLCFKNLKINPTVSGSQLSKSSQKIIKKWGGAAWFFE